MAWDRQAGTQVSVQKVAQLTPCSSEKDCPCNRAVRARAEFHQSPWHNQARSERGTRAQVVCKGSFCEIRQCLGKEDRCGWGQNSQRARVGQGVGVVVDTAVSSLVKMGSASLGAREGRLRSRACRATSFRSQEVRSGAIPRSTPPLSPPAEDSGLHQRPQSQLTRWVQARGWARPL